MLGDTLGTVEGPRPRSVVVLRRSVGEDGNTAAKICGKAGRCSSTQLARPTRRVL
jgi:hypothetical protein